MSSLSGYDSAVPTQQRDSATPIKDVVNGAFEEWLDSLKSLVADAPAQVSQLSSSICVFTLSFLSRSQKLQQEFQSLKSRLSESEALNQQVRQEPTDIRNE